MDRDDPTFVIYIHVSWWVGGNGYDSNDFFIIYLVLIF